MRRTSTTFSISRKRGSLILNRLLSKFAMQIWAGYFELYGKWERHFHVSWPELRIGLEICGSRPRPFLLSQCRGFLSFFNKSAFPTIHFAHSAGPMEATISHAPRLRAG